MKTVLVFAALVGILAGCAQEPVPDEGQVLAEACLAHHGAEQLKDPQGAYVISYKGGEENSGDIVVEYSAVNSYGGRDRDTVRCRMNTDGTVNGSWTLINWLEDQRAKSND